MTEYTFLITDHIEIKTQVTVEAANFDEAFTMVEGLAHEEMPTHERLMELTTNDLVERIIGTQFRIDS